MVISKENKNKRFLDLQQIAISYGGVCLSTEYTHSNTLMEWKCAISDHPPWKASAKSIYLEETWCKLCYFEDKKLSIEKLKEVASSYGGELLSNEYITARKIYNWKCKEGHIWEASAEKILYVKIWCPECLKIILANKEVKEKEEYKEQRLLEFKEIAKFYGGVCLSEKFTDMETPMEWKCKIKEHPSWEASAKSIHKNWCKECRFSNSDYLDKECIGCKNIKKILINKKLCEECIKNKQTASNRKQRAKKLEQGKCVNCKNDICKDSKQFCTDCKLKVSIGRRKLAKQNKEIVMLKYGGKCVCCGESNISFLTIDHKQEDGGKHRKETNLAGEKIYKWLIKNNFPKENYQILCINCNVSKHNNYGVCSHKKERKLSTWGEQALNIKAKVMEHYSEKKCVCCEETNLDFLNIDHIDENAPRPVNKKGKKLTGSKLYYWLVKQNFPVGFQVLCFNCNIGKYHFDKCPHKNEIMIQ